MSFSSPIYDDYNGTFLIFIQVMLQNLWVPKCNHSKFDISRKVQIFIQVMLQNLWAPECNHSKFDISRKEQFSCNYSVPRSINRAVVLAVLAHAANAVLDRSGDLRSRIL